MPHLLHFLSVWPWIVRYAALLMLGIVHRVWASSSCQACPSLWNQWLFLYWKPAEWVYRDPLGGLIIKPTAWISRPLAGITCAVPTVVVEKGLLLNTVSAVRLTIARRHYDDDVQKQGNAQVTGRKQHTCVVQRSERCVTSTKETKNEKHVRDGDNTRYVDRWYGYTTKEEEMKTYLAPLLSAIENDFCVTWLQTKQHEYIPVDYSTYSSQSLTYSNNNESGKNIDFTKTAKADNSAPENDNWIPTIKDKVEDIKSEANEKQEQYDNRGWHQSVQNYCGLPTCRSSKMTVNYQHDVRDDGKILAWRETQRWKTVKSLWWRLTVDRSCYMANGGRISGIYLYGTQATNDRRRR